jgi:hypothetical protein
VPRHKVGLRSISLHRNDKAWARFMWHLNERVRLDLKEEGAEALFKRTDCV